MAHRIAVQFGPGCRGFVPAGDLRRIAQAVLRAEDVASHVEAEVVLTTEEMVQNLNRLYRGKDEPTDVLSFASNEGEPFIESPGEAPSLGEVVVCLPVAQAQAKARGGDVSGDVAHLVVHGLLHLLGHDHEAGEEESQLMQAREDELLASLGYAGKYAHGH